MIKYITRQYNNPKSEYNGKYYAYPVVDETLNLDDMAKHMAEHNAGFSEAMCTGVLKALVKCTKEQLLAGKNVKIDDLAIFSIGIINNLGGAMSAKEFTTTNNIKGVKLRARSTGELSSVNLNLAASLKKATVVVNGIVIDEEPITPENPGNEDEGGDEPIVDEEGGGIGE